MTCLIVPTSHFVDMVNKRAMICFSGARYHCQGLFVALPLSDSGNAVAKLTYFIKW